MERQEEEKTRKGQRQRQGETGKGKTRIRKDKKRTRKDTTKKKRKERYINVEARCSDISGLRSMRFSLFRNFCSKRGLETRATAVGGFVALGVSSDSGRASTFSSE